MTICEELRQAVLQAAIQGKLTEQREEDGTAEELLEEIRKEKERLIKEGKIKKEKKLPEIDDVPFDIPENWKWVHVGDVLTSFSTGPFGSMLHKSDYSTQGVPLVNPANIIDGVIVYNEKAIVKHSEIERLSKYALKEGNIVIGRRGEMGRCAVVQKEQSGWLCGTGCFFMSVFSCVSTMFLKLLISGKYGSTFLEDNSIGTTMKNLNQLIITSMPIPLPPLAEQHRIVERVDSLMKQIDSLQTIEDELQSLKQAFPGNMRDAILQAAMQGKLTEQLESDGTAEELLEEIKKEKERLIKEGKIKKEKTLPEISEDEIPFDIPENWKWVRLGLISTYNQTKMKVNAKNLDSETWLLDLEDIEKGGKLLIRRTYSENKSIGEKTIFKKGNILYSKLRPYLLKILVADEDGACSPELVPFSCYGKISSDYVVSILKSPYVDNTINQATYGMKMPRVGTPTMVNLVLPLPPLAEQHRIVAKLNELLPLCDTLEEAK